MDAADRFEPRGFLDPLTGTRVVRLTPPGCHGLRNYFYQKAFTSDGRHLLWGCDQGGGPDLRLLDLATGLSRRLTRGPGVNVQGAYLSADDRFAYYTRGGRRHERVHLATGHEEVVHQVEAPWLSYGTWAPNTATTKVVGLVIHSEDRVTQGEGWERFAAQYRARPRMRLVEVDLATGRDRILFEDRRSLGHPMYRPHDDQLVTFCHEGPHDLVDSRIWFVAADGTGLRRAKDQAPGEAVMHEFWVPDGSRLYYVSYLKGTGRRSLWAALPDRPHERVMDLPALAHLMANHDGSLLVGDGAGQSGDLADPSAFAFEADPMVHLVDPHTRTHRPLCGHHSSWKVYGGNTQASHPHPSFTPDGRQVLFASDFEGELALYRADLP